VLDCPELRELIIQTLDAGSGPLLASREIVLSKCPYMVNVSPVLEPGGETLGAVAVLRDIAPLKKLEAAKSVFVSMVAHGLKNHLAAVEGYLNLIVSGLAGKDPQRDHEMMQRAVVRLTTLRQMISELTGLSSMETGHFTITRSPLDIMEVVDEAVQMYKPKADEKGIDLSVRCASPVPRVLADRSAMSTVLTNLIDNAIKYTPEHGRVSVGVESDRVHVKIKVRDSGIGMSPEDQEKVFDEFFRVRNEETANIVGTGLGLTIVKRLVAMHNGAVAVASAPGKGSEFTVTLPRIEQSTEGRR
jgi:signal transduction histidine kinase